jgi:hypothetical protein
MTTIVYDVDDFLSAEIEDDEDFQKFLEEGLDDIEVTEDELDELDMGKLGKEFSFLNYDENEELML